MAIISGIFNSVNGDRRYDARWFARYFATFIGNGVFPNPSTGLQVMENTNMTTAVKAGDGWINGYFIVNDSDYVLQHDVADGVLKRIDRVVMRLDFYERKINIVVKKGTFASTPVAPTLQRDADAYELGIADVSINNGATFISQANITDLRLNKSLCGIVHGTVDQVDTTTIFNQYLAWFEQFKLEVTDNNTQWQATNRRDFDAWFATIQGVLEGDIAANLASRIAGLEGVVTTLATKTEVSDVASNLTTHLADDASLLKKGHVQLSNATNSTSTALAATPSAVKAAMDKADVANVRLDNLPEFTLSAEGTFPGDQTTNRKIDIGFTPRFVSIKQNGHPRVIILTGSDGLSLYQSMFENLPNAKIVPNGFQVTGSANYSSYIYSWAAFR